MRWDSPLAHFSVLALGAECLDLKLHRTLLQEGDTRSSRHVVTIAPLQGPIGRHRSLPCRRHVVLVGVPLSKAGCLETVKKNNTRPKLKQAPLRKSCVLYTAKRRKLFPDGITPNHVTFTPQSNRLFADQHRRLTSKKNGYALSPSLRSSLACVLVWIPFSRS